MKKISRYEIREPIGSGAMGQVFLAFDPVIQRTVALKTLDRELLPSSQVQETVDRFKREAIAAGRLTHPNIITVYEYGESDQLCFISMEHASGQTLQRYLASNPIPAFDTVRAIARQLFAAMVYAHEQDVLHRDLKPSNVVIMGDPADGASLQVKILDFGIARINSAAALTQIGSVVGTPAYMSPEQYLGNPLDGRTDIYGLAVTLFEMLAGTRPFAGTMIEVLRQLVRKEPPLISSIRPGLPAQLDPVFAKALARDPGARYASMREFREAFVAAIASLQGTTIDIAGVSFEVAAPVNSGISPRQTDTSSGASHSHWTRQLPGMERPIVTMPPSSHTGGTREKPRILFLDDEERILSVLSALFRLKYEVLLSSDGRQALELVKTHRPHVIVSDQRMPNMLGVDFLRQAREIDPSAVRILLTGYSDLAAIVGSINDGEVFRFVNKPWINQDIKDTIAQAVEIALATRQAAFPAPPARKVSEIYRASEAILVAQRTREIFEMVNEGFGRTHPVCHAADVASIMQTIEDQEVAVLLCDLDGFEDADVMLKMLKQSHPQIQSVAVAANSDSDSLIRLINQAQIFRFMSRPLRQGLLDRGLRSALAVYANYKARPVLVQRQKVQASLDAAESSMGRQILHRLGFLAKPKLTSSSH